MSDPLAPEHSPQGGRPHDTPAPRGPGSDPAPSPPLERRRRTVGWRTGDVLRAAALVIGLYIILQLLWFASALVFIVFLAILFGLAVEAGVDKLQRLHIPRGVGAVLIVGAFFGLLVAFGAPKAPTLRLQYRELTNRLPQALDEVERWIEQRRGGALGFLFEGFAPAPDTTALDPGMTRVDTVVRIDTLIITRRAVEDTAADTVPGEEEGEDAQEMRVDTIRLSGGPTTGTAVQAPGLQPTESPPGAMDTTRLPERARPAPAPEGATLRERLTEQLSGVRGYLFSFLSSTLAIVSGILLIIVLAIFIAAEPDVYHRGLMHLFPHHMRPRAGEVLSTTATVLRRWLITQLIGMVVIAVVTTTVLLILGVQAAFVLGVLAGVLEFIPTIGPILAAVPAIAMGFLDSPQKALSVAIAYLIIQQLESNILMPLLMKEGVSLPPALTLVAQALMAIVFGFLGLLVAVPLVAAVMVPIKMLYVEGVVGDDVEILGGEEDD